MSVPEHNQRKSAVKTALLLGAVALAFYVAFFVSKF